MARIFLLCLAVVLACLAPLTPAQALMHSYEGFGATTPGGAGQPVVHVTTLSDECTPVVDAEGNPDCIPVEGTLRWAVSDHLSFTDKGYRTVVFDVAGEIHLRQPIRVRGPFQTIDCSSAPSPGITIKDAGLAFHGTKDAHDIIIRGCRIREATPRPNFDGITIAFGAYNIVVDRLSLWSAADELIDISEDSHDITISWSILAGPGKNMLIKNFPSRTARVTLHHNILMDGGRNPQAAIDNDGTPAADTTLDARNLLVWNWHSRGTLVEKGAWANVVNNYYWPSSGAIAISSARAYVKGNLTGNNKNVNTRGTEQTPFSAPPVETQDACTAAALVLAHAGARPLDNIDRDRLSSIALACSCGSPPQLSVTPRRLSFTSPSGELVPDQMLALAAQGGGSASWNSHVLTTLGGSWLAVSPTTGVTPATLAVTANPAGLAQGLYEGRVIVEADGSPNSFQVIPVSLRVGPAPPGPESLEMRVACGGDDGKESSLTVALSANTLAVGKGNLVAFRLTNVPIPPGVIIESAQLSLYSTADQGKNIAIRYLAEATGDSAPLKKLPANLSSRPKTQAFVDDVPARWTQFSFNPSPDLSPVLQEIVSRPDWKEGNSLTLFIADNGSSGVRKIASLETLPPGLRGAILQVTYQVP